MAVNIASAKRGGSPLDAKGSISRQVPMSMSIRYPAAIILAEDIRFTGEYFPPVISSSKSLNLLTSSPPY